MSASGLRGWTRGRAPAPAAGPAAPPLPPPAPGARGPHLEGELVDWVDLVQVVQYEVEQGGPLRRGPVVLSRLVDFDLCDFCLLYLETHTRGVGRTRGRTAPLSTRGPLGAVPGALGRPPGCRGPPRPFLATRRGGGGELTFSSISLAVCLVVSRFSTRAVSPRKFPEAADSRASRESSSSLRTILNSF